MLSDTFKRKTACLLAGALITTTPFAQGVTELQRHVQAATIIAGNDVLLTDAYRKYWCMFAEDRLDLQQAARADTGRVPLIQLFDDAWYVGSRYVGQFIFRSDTGFMIADTLNNTAEATTWTTPSLLTLGVGATLPLKDVYLTHGHGDHDGGANYLRQTYNPNIYMGSADANGKAYSPILVNSADLSPKTYQMGGRSVVLVPTPGHTAGSTSAIVPVRDGGVWLNALIIGGSSMPATIAGSKTYLDSVERQYDLARQMKVAASLHPHPVFDGTLRNIEGIQAGGTSVPSRFNVGHERLMRGLAIYRECSAAYAAKLDATAVMPVWRPTKLEFTAASPSPTRASAKLSSDWGPVANKQVTFSVEGTGAACLATTDTNGVATCNTNFGPFRAGIDKMTATFEGNSETDYRNLPAAKTSTVNLGCDDLSAARAAIGSRAGSQAYSARLDVDGNGVIDIRDIAAIARLVPASAACR